MMQTFQVNEKVRVVKLNDDSSAEVGMEGVIVAYMPDETKQDYFVHFGSTICWLMEDELERVNDGSVSKER